MKVVLILLAVIGILAIVAVGGIIAAGFWGIGQFEDVVEAEITTQPEFMERVGPVTDFSAAFGEKDEETRGMVFNFVGAKASGKAVVFEDEDKQTVARILIDGAEPFEISCDIEGGFERKYGGDVTIENTSGDATSSDTAPTEAVPTEADPADTALPTSQPQTKG